MPAKQFKITLDNFMENRPKACVKQKDKSRKGKHLAYTEGFSHLVQTFNLIFLTGWYLGGD